MINEKEIEALKHTPYNSDLVVMEMLDTVEKLWCVAHHAGAYYLEMNNRGCRTRDGTGERLAESLKEVFPELMKNYERPL